MHLNDSLTSIKSVQSKNLLGHLLLVCKASSRHNIKKLLRTHSAKIPFRPSWKAPTLALQSHFKRSSFSIALLQQKLGA